MKSPSSLFASLLIGSACFGSSLQAAVVGYWRFENASSLGADSGSNSLTLTNNNSVTSVSTPFSNPVPQTGAANLLAADFESGSTQSLSIADNAAFAFQDFTIESYVRLESTDSSNPRIIASQLNTGTGASQAWQFGISSTGSGLGNTRLFLQVSSLISNPSSALLSLAPSSGFTFTTGINYYTAASVHFTGTQAQVTFYMQDLTNNGALLSTSVSGASTGLYDSNANFAIGSSYTAGSPSRFFDGVLDEVRLSNTALASTALLAVPEPSVYLLSALGGVFAIVFARRRRTV